MFKQQMFRSLVCVVLAISIFIIGCGGHAANPVERYMPGDEKKSCELLLSEMSLNDQEVIQKKQKAKSRNLWNGVEFVSGFFLIVPWFFMDVKGSYEVEIDALKARNKMLKGYYTEKGCSIAGVSDVAN